MVIAISLPRATVNSGAWFPWSTPAIGSTEVQVDAPVGSTAAAPTSSTTATAPFQSSTRWMLLTGGSGRVVHVCAFRSKLASTGPPGAQAPATTTLPPKDAPVLGQLGAEGR